VNVIVPKPFLLYSVPLMNSFNKTESAFFSRAGYASWGLSLSSVYLRLKIYNRFSHILWRFFQNNSNTFVLLTQQVENYVWYKSKTATKYVMRVARKQYHLHMPINVQNLEIKMHNPSKYQSHCVINCTMTVYRLSMNTVNNNSVS